MGETPNQPFQLSFNRFLRVDAASSKKFFKCSGIDFQCRLLKKISGGSGIPGSRVTSGVCVITGFCSAGL